MSGMGHNSGTIPYIFRTCTADEPHTRVRNAMINDRDLGDDLLGILTYLLSKPPDWIINPSELADRFGCAERTIRRKLAALKELGYYWHHQPQDEHGKMADAERFVADDPTVGQICQTYTVGQICQAVEELAKSRGKDYSNRRTKMTSGPLAKKPHAVKRRHTKNRSSLQKNEGGAGAPKKTPKSKRESGSTSPKANGKLNGKNGHAVPPIMTGDEWGDILNPNRTASSKDIWIDEKSGAPGFTDEHRDVLRGLGFSDQHIDKARFTCAKNCNERMPPETLKRHLLTACGYAKDDAEKEARRQAAMARKSGDKAL